MFCSQCSTPIPEDGLFCPECGQKVTVSAPPPAASVPQSYENPPSASPLPVPFPQNQVLADPSMEPPIRESSLRREKRRQRRRHARGFWFHPVTNLIILALSAAGGFFIPREILVYVTGYDLSSLMAKSAQLFQYNSLRDGWDAAKDAILAIALTVLLLVLTVMGIAAIVRMFKRMLVGSRRKKEWKKEKQELLRRELTEDLSVGSR